MTKQADAFVNLAFDRAATSRAFDDDGHLHVAGTNISKANICPYMGREIPDWDKHGLNPEKEYRLLRDPEELAKGAETFCGKPLLWTHRPVTSLDHDFEGTIGSVSNARYEHPYVKADLAVWHGPAIDAIKSGEQKELSSAYRYELDPSPGTYEGQQYDGVMRGIKANHVAVVREGRAGKDCVVGDELPETLRGLSMSKTAALSRTAIAGPIALAALLKPKLARDAKIDWSPLFKGVDAKNFKSKKPKMAADMKLQLKGKLAQDADASDLAELLDVLETVIPEAGPDVEFKKIDDMPKPGEDPATDADDTALREFLKGLGLSEEDIEKACSMASAPAAMDDNDDASHGLNDPGVVGVNTATDPEDAAQGSTGPGRKTASAGAADRKAMDKRAMDELRKSLTVATSKIAAMDAKIEKARNDGAADAIRTQREIFSAINFVKPWVGESHAFDSADCAADVLRTALIAMDEKDIDDLPEKAMRRIIEKLPKPGEQRSHRGHVAMDASIAKGFSERYPDAARIRTL